MKAQVFALTLIVFSTPVSWSDQACAAAFAPPPIFALTNPDHSSTRQEFDDLLKRYSFAERGGLLREDLAFGKFINCHAFAALVSAVPGIASDTWIVPSNASDARTKSVYYEGVLERYFNPVMGLDLDKKSPPGLERIEVGDLVVFLSEEKILHSGVVERVSGFDLKSVRILSKLGPWPVVDASLELTANLYAAEAVHVYRRNQNLDRVVTVPYAQ